MGDQVSDFKKHVMCKNPTLKNALKTLGTINRYWFNVGDYPEQWVTTVACFWVQMYPKTEETIKLVDKYIIPYEDDKYNVDDRRDLILKMLDTKTFSMKLIYDYINSEQPCHGEEIILSIILQHVHLCSEYYSDDDIEKMISELFVPSIREMGKYANDSLMNSRYKLGLELLLRTTTLHKGKLKAIVPTDKRSANSWLIREIQDMITKLTLAKEGMKHTKNVVSA